MSGNYLSLQRREVKRAINELLCDALRSSARTAASFGVAAAIAMGGLSYARNAVEPSSWLLRFLAASQAASLAATAFFLTSARMDWAEWSEANAQRSEIMVSGFRSQAEAINQGALLWHAWQSAAAQHSIKMAFEQQRGGGAIATRAATIEDKGTLVLPPSPHDPAYTLGTDPTSALIAGVPGSGKGTVVANALQHLRVHRPDVKVFVLDPKADPKERGNWRGADVVQARHIAEMEPHETVEWFYAFLDKFLDHRGPKLLIIDEGSALLATLKLVKDGDKRLKAFLAHVTSMGPSRDEMLWLLVQIVHVADLGLSGGYRSVLKAVAIASPKNRQALNAFLSTGFVETPGAGECSIDDLMRASPCGRAVFDGASARWYPLAALPNVCGYDRDTRSFDATGAAAAPAPAAAVEVQGDRRRAWPSGLGTAATTVADYLRRNGPIAEVSRIEANLSGTPYRMARAATRAAVAELQRAGVVDLRDGVAALMVCYR